MIARIIPIAINSMIGNILCFCFSKSVKRRIPETESPQHKITDTAIIDHPGANKLSISVSKTHKQPTNFINWLMRLYSINAGDNVIVYTIYSDIKTMILHAFPPAAILTIGQITAVNKINNFIKFIIFSCSTLCFSMCGYVILICIYFTSLYRRRYSIRTKQIIHFFFKSGVCCRFCD